MAAPGPTLSPEEATLRSEEFLSLSREDQVAVIASDRRLSETARRVGFRPGLQPGQAGPPAQPQQPSAIRRALPSRETARGLATGAGAAIGGVTAGGPSAGLGFPAGMALGAGAGGQAFDLGEAILRGQQPQTQGVLETAAGATRQAGVDVATDLAASALPGSVGRAAQRGKSFLLGITPEAVLEFEQSALRGINLGIEQVSEAGIIRRFRNVAGRFPLLAGPLQKGQKRLGVEAATSLQDTIDSIAPVGSYVDLGANFRDAAKKNVSGLRGVINANYERFSRLAADSGARVPLQTSRAYASDLVRRAREFGGPLERAVKEADKVLKLGRTETSPGVMEIQPIDVRRWRGAVQDVDVAIRQLADEGNPVASGELAQLRKAMEFDLQSLEGPPEVRAALGEANASFERFARLFRDVPQGQRLQRGEPRLFGELQGSKGLAQQEVDRLYDTVFRQQIKSPQAIEDLARIVNNPTLMKRAGANLISDVGADAIRINQENGQTFLNLRKLTNDLGLFDDRSPKRRSLQITIGRENLKNLEGVVRALERVADTSFINVSDFVARRGLLGGARSVLRSFTPGIDTEGNISDVIKKAAGLVAFIMNGRRFGEFITDPKAMRAAADALSTSNIRQPSAKAAALLRFAGVAPEFFDVESTGEGLIPVSQRPGLAGGSIRGAARVANLAPLAVGGGLSIPRATRGLGTAISGVTAGEVLRDLEGLAVMIRDRGKKSGREFNELAGQRARR